MSAMPGRTISARLIAEIHNGAGVQSDPFFFVVTEAFISYGNTPKLY